MVKRPISKLYPLEAGNNIKRNEVVVEFVDENDVELF